MDIVAQKSEEDLLLATCDGTCSNGEKCRCIVDIGTELAGQAMFDYGFTTCVLCQRAIGQQYCTIPENYPVSWIYDGYKIKYDKGNYRRIGTNSIEQVIDQVCEDDTYKESWISSLYYTSTELVDVNSVNWKLVVCDTPKCKHPVHAYIDVHRAIGVSNSYYDVVDECVKCEFCHKALRYIFSNNGIVEYNNQSYTQCRFCSTIIFFSPKVPVQVCTTCTAQCKSDVQKGRHICFYCKNSVNVSQRKNIQEFKIRKTPTSRTETVYLCRLHRVYPPEPTKIFKISELLSMF
jgi:hypothetical protein